MGAGVCMLAGAFAFAVMGALTHALAGRCDWLIIALCRAVFMLLWTIGSAKARGVKLAFWKPRTLWLRSLAGSLSLVCNFYALTELPIADALTLLNTYPIWIVLLSSLFLRMPPTVAEVVGIVCGVVGVVLIERPSLGGSELAIGVALLGAFSTSVALLGLHRLKGVDARAIMAHFAGVASVVTGVGLLAKGPAVLEGDWNATTVGLVLGVSVFGTAGQFLLTKAYSKGVPARLSAIGLVQVAFAMAFDTLIWGRSFSAIALVGFALVVAPTAWLSVRAGARLNKMRDVGPSQVGEAEEEAMTASSRA